MLTFSKTNSQFKKIQGFKSYGVIVYEHLIRVVVTSEVLCGEHWVGTCIMRQVSRPLAAAERCPLSSGFTWLLYDRIASIGNFFSLCFIWVLVLIEVTAGTTDKDTSTLNVLIKYVFFWSLTLLYSRMFRRAFWQKPVSTVFNMATPPMCPLCGFKGSYVRKRLAFQLTRIPNCDCWLLAAVFH